MTDTTKGVASTNVALRTRSLFVLAGGIFGLMLAELIGNAAEPLVLALLRVTAVGGLIYFVVLRRRLRHELARQAAQNDTLPVKPSWQALAGVAVSRVILAAILAITYDPIMISLLGVLCVVGLLGAAIFYRSRPAAARLHLVKAPIYGVAAVIAFAGHANDENNADLLVAKLAEYERQHGSYPERLDTLVPKYVPAIPRPSMSSFHYLRHEKSYVLIYNPSVAGPCSYRPEKAAWSCRAR